jgi:hypothetical protein
MASSTAIGLPQTPPRHAGRAHAGTRSALSGGFASLRLRLKATTLFRDRYRHCTCRLACACAGLEDRRDALQIVKIPRVAYNGGGEYMLQQGGWHGEQGSPWTSPSPLALANRVRRLCCSTRSWKWRRSVITVIHHEPNTGRKQALCG